MMLMHRTETGAPEVREEFEWHHFLRSFTRRWRFIAIITAVTTFLALYYILNSPPLFAALGTVYLPEGDNTPANAADSTSFMSDYQVVSTVNAQLLLLTAPALLEQAVLETGMNVQIVPAGSQPLPYWRWRFQHGKAINFFAPGPDTLIAPFAIFGDPSVSGAAFRIVFGKDGHFNIIIPARMFSKAVQIGTGEWNKPALAGGAAFVIKSAVGAKPPAEGKAYDVTIIPAKVMAMEIAGSLSVTASGPAVSPTNIAAIQFTSNNPYQATVFVQQLMQDFIRSQMDWATQSASNTETYISQQLDKISAALENANTNQAVYQSQTGIVDVTSSAQAMVGQLSAYQSQRSTILLQQEALQQLIKNFSNHAAKINPYLITESADPVLSSLATTLTDAEQKLQTDQMQYGPRSPQIRQQNGTIDEIEGAIGQLLTNDEDIAEKNLSNIDTLIAKYQNQLKSVPAETLKVGQLSRSADVLGTLYQLLMQKEEEAEVSKAATSEDTRIVSPPELPLNAVAPKPTITLAAGILLGLFASTAIIIIQQAFSSKFRTEAEVRHLMPSSIYGVVPRRRKAELKSGILEAVARSPFTESLRVLEGKLSQLQRMEKCCVVLITSPSELDGKTTIATNIANILANGTRRVLLIDADIEYGSLHRGLALPHGPGLAEALLKGSSPQIVTSDEFRFKLLRAGQSTLSSTELLSTEKMKAMLSALMQQFDFIILDSPPIPLLSDGLILAKFSDIVLSVVRIEHTNRRDFNAHCEVFQGTSNLYGVIINGVETANAADYATSNRSGRRSGGRRRSILSPARLFGRFLPKRARAG